MMYTTIINKNLKEYNTMPDYEIRSTVPTYYLYRVTADTAEEAMRLVDGDEVQADEKSTDWDGSTAKIIAIDGVEV